MLIIKAIFTEIYPQVQRTTIATFDNFDSWQWRPKTGAGKIDVHLKENGGNGFRMRQQCCEFYNSYFKELTLMEKALEIN